MASLVSYLGLSYINSLAAIRHILGLFPTLMQRSQCKCILVTGVTVWSYAGVRRRPLFSLFLLSEKSERDLPTSERENGWWVAYGSITTTPPSHRLTQVDQIWFIIRKDQKASYIALQLYNTPIT